MKNTKKIFVFFVIIIGLFIINTQKTFAMKTAIYPNPKSLYLVPKDTKPNISGNIDNTTQSTLNNEKEANSETNEVVDKNNQTTPETTLIKKEILPYKFIIIIFAIIILILFFLYKKLKKMEI